MAHKNILNVVAAVSVSVITMLVTSINGAHEGSNGFIVLFNDYYMGTIRCDIGELVPLFLKLLPVFIYQYLWSTYLYENLYSSGIYYFVRFTNRKKWFFKHCLILFVSAVIFSTIYMLFGSIIPLIDRASFHAYDISIVLIATLCYAAFLFLTTLTIHILSLRFGSNISYIIIYSVIALFCLIFVMHISYISHQVTQQGIDTYALMGTDQFLFYINPIPNIGIAYHHYLSSTQLNNVLNIWDFKMMGMPTWGFSFIYLFLLNTMIVAFGWKVIKISDFSLKDKEVSDE